MKELGITKGECRVIDVGDYFRVECDGSLIVPEVCSGPTHEKSDADLIADAFNTAQSCGLLPSELLKQRDQLLTALKELVHLHGCEQEGILSGQPTPEQWYAAVDAAESAIKSSER